MRARAVFAPLGLFAGVLALSACDLLESEPEPEVTDEGEVPAELQPTPAEDADGSTEQLGTPMAERMATIGLVNKRNNISRDIEMYPGEARRFDDVIIRLSACERTAPWEDPQQTGAFVQVFVNERRSVGADAQWYSVFSGWLFKESPSLNVVEHPVYDVWLKECAMSFPGEEDAPESAPAPSASAEETS